MIHFIAKKQSAVFLAENSRKTVPAFADEPD